MSPIAESILISFGVGLVVLAVGLMINRISRPVAVLLAVGVAIIVIVVWPRALLVEVPDLADLSRDDAVLRLSSAKLVGVPEPQQAPNTLVEHVIGGSQDIPPGTRVKPGTVVRFAVSAPSPPLPPGDSSALGTASISVPKNGDEVVAKRAADNIFRFSVAGTMAGVDLKKSTLLLWVQPVDPPSDQPGWYLQRLPSNGIRSISGDQWHGTCQIGNQDYPPHDGDTVQAAVTVVPGDEAQRLLVRHGPVTSITLPGSVSKVVQLKLRTH